MANGKYIVLLAQEAPILFPNFLSHNDMANFFGGRAKVISAGFFEVGAEKTERDADNISVSVFGKSTTLKIGVRGEKDSRLIQRLLRSQDW